MMSGQSDSEQNQPSVSMNPACSRRARPATVWSTVVCHVHVMVQLFSVAPRARRQSTGSWLKKGASPITTTCRARARIDSIVDLNVLTIESARASIAPAYEPVTSITSGCSAAARAIAHRYQARHSAPEGTGGSLYATTRSIHL